ncbi:MAG: hypothetical protein HC910_12135 [Spirulinaceae cyanobacterium SM2_1_0]|nr:hypothetical protein [Spirulinaceae cyanobacterium SM2_1_0]
MALVGVAALFWGLVTQSGLTFELLVQAIAFENLWLSVGLTTTAAIALGLSLGLSYYLLVPLARWLQR